MSADYLNSEFCAIEKALVSLSVDGKNYTTLDDQTLLSVGMSFSIFSPMVTVQCTINDFQGYFNIIDTSKPFYMKVQLVDQFALYTDVTKASVYRTFRILNCSRAEANRTSCWTMTGIDDLSYLLSTTYLKRNQTTNATGMFQSLIGALSLDAKVTEYKSTLDVSVPKEDEAYGAIRVTSDQALLKQLVKLGAEHNCHFFQTLHTVHFGEMSVKNLKTDTLKDVNGNELTFSNAIPPERAQFVGKIHEYYPFMGNQKKSIDNPVTMTQIQQTSDTYKTSNSAMTVFEDIALNGNMNYLSSQETTGTRSDPNGFNTPGLQKYNLIRQFLQFNKLVLHVPGCFAYNDIYKVCNVKILPRTISNSQTIEGTRKLSGKWLIGGADYLVSFGTFKTRLSLYRYDNPEK